MGKGGGTIGYHYLCSMLFGIGRGPVNELLKIKIGGEMAFEGNVLDDTLTPIDKPELFGGEKKEGGIQGLFRSLMGTASQVIPGAGSMGLSKGPNSSATLPFLRESLSPGDPDDVPEFRGRHVFWYDGLVSSMNPYIKDWEFRRWRTTRGWYGYPDGDCWYKAKATIYLHGENDERIYAMNPAHIILQASYDPVLGRGTEMDEHDLDSFVLAANTFCAEEFGLCFDWKREDEVGNFIQSVCDHAGAVVYTDRETGLINLKAIRNDYDPATLPHFSPNNGLLSISEDDAGSSDEVADEVIINGKSPVTNQAIQGRAHNLAVRLFRGGATTKTVDYPGLPTVGLCNRVAERDRNIGAGGLRKFRVVLDRAGFRIHPGAVFKVSYAPRGLAGIVLRAGEIDDGNMINGSITVDCVQDVFSLPLTSFVTPVENTWQPPSKEAEPAVAELIEATYRDLYLRLSTADLNAIAPEAAYPAAVAAQPTVSSLTYDLLDRAEGETAWPTTLATNFFTPMALLNANINAIVTTFVVKNVNDFPADEDSMENKALYCNGEYMRIESYDSVTKTFTVERGCVDTWPKAHLVNAKVWLVDDDLGYNGRVYVAGETVEAKVLPRTTTSVLPEGDATLMTRDMDGRAFRPYPPADVKVNGASIFGVSAPEEDEPEITWVERNRVTQADFLVGFHEATVTAETGTTYKIVLFDEDDVEVTSYVPITSPWTYTSADQTADGLDDAVIFARIYAIRDGVDSLEQSKFLLKSGSSLSTDGDILYADGDDIEA